MPRQLTAAEIIRSLAKLRIRTEALAARLAELANIPLRSRRGWRTVQADRLRSGTGAIFARSARLRAKIAELKVRSSGPGPRA